MNPTSFTQPTGRPISQSGQSTTTSESYFNPVRWFKGLWEYTQNAWHNPVEHLVMPIATFALILLGAIILLRLTRKMINHIFRLTRLSDPKALTLRELCQSILRYTIFFIAGLTILTSLGLNPIPILASVSFIGLAVGFGAQSLIRDIITGFFLIFERQLEVGDYVQINEKIQGTVEEVGLRVTKIREYNQRLHYIANGYIKLVTNSNRERMRIMVTIHLLPSANLQTVYQALTEAADDLQKKFSEAILEKPEVLGITQMDANGIQCTVAALVLPEKKWKLECWLRETVLQTLQRHQMHNSVYTVTTAPSVSQPISSTLSSENEKKLTQKKVKKEREEAKEQKNKK